ncbi:hypothetical protein G6F56_011531 [Rhizopus delemar]|nr:hypothetical protein G6F56_011531 [Rhizopus delemar]
MLRPSKLFVSFHQLRHFFQTRIAEVAVNNQPIVRYSITQQPSLQQLFTHIFQKPAHIPAAQQQQAKILKVLQHHFPVVKVFSNPTVRRPALGLWTGQQQSRTMMSGTPGWGIPRHPAFGRGPTARQFSTTKPPCVFQQTQSPFAQISRIFSPAGAKINTPLDQANLSSAKVSVLKKQEPESHLDRIFAPQNKGMRVLVEEDVQQGVHSTKPTALAIVHHDSLSQKNVLLQSERDLISTLVESHGFVHCSLALDLLQFLDTGTVNDVMIGSIERLHHRYHIHMHHVLNILQRLQPYLDRTLKARIEHGRLLIEFLTARNKQDAIRLLETLSVFPPEKEIKTPVDIDYFNDIQTFIDHIDALIDYGPAFKNSLHVE